MNKIDEINIQPFIGALNARQPFVKYITQKANKMFEKGLSKQDIVSIVKVEYEFWSKLLRDQMDKYDLMRKEGSGLKREYVLIHYEFDDLFRYCSDPVKAFKIDFNQELDQRQIKNLINDFKEFINKQRKHLPKIDYPMSLTSFYFKAYISIAKTIINLPFMLIFKKKVFNDFWSRVFISTETDEKEEIKKAKNFWKVVLCLSMLFNFIVAIYMIKGIINLSGIEQFFNIIFAFLIELMLIPISTRAFVQFGRLWIAFYYSRKYAVSRIKTWKNFKVHFNRVWLDSDSYTKKLYYNMVEEMYSEYLINNKEYKLLINKNFNNKFSNKFVTERLKRWMNNFYMADKQGNSLNYIPEINSWDEVYTLTILIFSLSEKFSYTWDELIRNEIDKKKVIKPIIKILRENYSNEWNNLIESISPFLSNVETQILLNKKSDLSAFKNNEMISIIEKWANLRLQTLYNTLTGAIKIFDVYENLAKRFFPSADLEQIRKLVREKINIIFLHDNYPNYEKDNPQKINIDEYISKHPDVKLHLVFRKKLFLDQFQKSHPESEITWHDLLHPSKSGAWANVLPSITGEFLMTLDADHSMCFEEVYYLPNLLSEFKLNLDLDAIQYRLYSYNSRYSWASLLAGLAGESWWIQDLRVKAIVGGGGAFGKVIYRTSSIKEKELIQPDSVGEDMLTTSRLLAENSAMKFIEYIQIGQGEDVTYTGLKRKYGRYPIGGLESSLSKLFQEMLLSKKAPWNKKAEALFMVSFYPVQGLIVFAVFIALLSLLFKINPYNYLPFEIIALGYLFIISDSLLPLVNLTEKLGYLSGILNYILIFVPMNIFHASYIPHYLQQLNKSLKGFARFNISKKTSEYLEDNWNETYFNNKFTLNIGSLLVGLFALGAIVHPLTLLDHIVFFPFIYCSFIWLVGIFIFIPRKNFLIKILDIIIGIPYIIVKSYYDITLKWLFNVFKTVYSNH